VLRKPTALRSLPEPITPRYVSSLRGYPAVWCGGKPDSSVRLTDSFDVSRVYRGQHCPPRRETQGLPGYWPTYSQTCRAPRPRRSAPILPSVKKDGFAVLPSTHGNRLSTKYCPLSRLPLT